MADTVASRSTFLSTYMGNHPDTLVAYVRHFGKVNVPVVSASMLSINKNAMTISYVVMGKALKEQTMIKFDPSLSGYEEVKPRLLQMKLEAEEALGMARRPQVSTFEIPPSLAITLFPLLLLIHVTFSVTLPAASVYNTVYNIGPWLRDAVGGPSTIRNVWIFVFVMHVSETLYTVSLCRRHATGVLNGAKWTFFTLLFGLPVLLRLRKLITKARIDSIMKTH